MFQKIINGYISYFLDQGGQLLELFARETNLKKQSSVNWSEVHFYRSNFLQDPYFKSLIKNPSRNRFHVILMGKKTRLYSYCPPNSA